MYMLPPKAPSARFSREGPRHLPQMRLKWPESGKIRTSLGRMNPRQSGRVSWVFSQRYMSDSQSYRTGKVDRSFLLVIYTYVYIDKYFLYICIYIYIHKLVGGV